MQNLKDMFRALLSEEAGQGLVEYGLILALVSLGAVIALTTLGTDISGAFGKASAQLKKN